MKIYMKILLLTGFVLLLFGCSKKDNTIQFKEEMVLEYNSKKSPLTLIKCIGDTKINYEMIDDDTLICGNTVIKCDNVDTSVLTDYQVKFETNDTENHWITKTVSIKDTTPPQIALKGLDQKKSITLLYKDFQKYNFSKNIEVRDNYDHNPVVQVEVQNKLSDSEYMIVVKASDCFDNISQETFKVNIKQKDFISNKKDNSTDKNSNKKKHNVSSNKKKRQAKTSIDTSIKKQNFYFGKTYELNGKKVECSMKNVNAICTSKLSKSGKSGSCIPITDKNGIYIGMALNFN